MGRNLTLAYKSIVTLL